MYLTRLRIIATLVLLTTVTSGCALLNPKPIPVEIRTVPVKVPITQPVLPRKIDLKEPYWYVVSEKNIDEFLVKNKKESNGVFFAMSAGDYELMAYNLQEIKRYVKELKQVVVYYKKVTTYDDEPDDEQNSGGNNATTTNEGG
jgi:hypothetical protein